MMENINLIFVLVVLIFWKTFFSKYKITLSSPIFRNTETKELGCWAELKKKISFPPFPGLVIYDGQGGQYRIRNVQWDLKEKYFFCDTYHDQPRCVDEGQYEHIKKSVAEFGWELREVSPGHILNSWKEEYER